MKLTQEIKTDILLAYLSILLIIGHVTTYFQSNFKLMLLKFEKL